jgi:hypothetical protein
MSSNWVLGTFKQVFMTCEHLNERGTYVKPLCVGKDLWPCSSMANIVTQLWSKY